MTVLLPFSCKVVFKSSWPHNCSTPVFLVLHSFLEFSQTPVHWFSDAIEPSYLCLSLLLLLQSSPASRFFPISGLFTSGGQSIGASASASVRIFIIFRVDFLQDWLVWFSCYPRDSQESSPTLLFRNTNSSVLSLLYGPPLTSVHDYWKIIALTIQTFVSKDSFKKV